MNRPVRIHGIIWLPEIREKIVAKHAVRPVEVEQVLEGKPHVRRVSRGYRRGEDVYAALGRTAEGRLLIVFFIRKLMSDALIISARDIDAKERQRYAKIQG